jgi:hypothetical protein
LAFRAERKTILGIAIRKLNTFRKAFERKKAAAGGGSTMARHGSIAAVDFCRLTPRPIHERIATSFRQYFP